MTTPKIVIEVKGGSIINIVATQNIDVVLIDHDFEEDLRATELALDDVLSPKALNDYIENTINEEK